MSIFLAWIKIRYVSVRKTSSGLGPAPGSNEKHIRVFSKSRGLPSSGMWPDVLRQLNGLTLKGRNDQEEFLGVPAKIQTGHIPSIVRNVSTCISLLGAM